MNPSHNNLNIDAVCGWIKELNYIQTRKNALYELSKITNTIRNLAPMLWFSFGTVPALLQEIIRIYPSIFSPNLSATEADPVCRALTLLQCLASHPETRSHLLSANIPMYIYPFINASGTTKPYEYLRLSSLGVIAEVANSNEKAVINYLLRAEVIPLCLKVMENYPENNNVNDDDKYNAIYNNKTVATNIMQKILSDEGGLVHTCETYERFSHVARSLGVMVMQIARDLQNPNRNRSSVTLLRHIISCFLRLGENPRAREALSGCVPELLINGKLSLFLTEECRRLLYQLKRMLEERD